MPTQRQKLITLALSLLWFVGFGYGFPAGSGLQALSILGLLFAAIVGAAWLDDRPSVPRRPRR